MPDVIIGIERGGAVVAKQVFDSLSGDLPELKYLDICASRDTTKAKRKSGIASLFRLLPLSLLDMLCLLEQYNSPDYQVVLCTAALFHYATPYADKYEISRVFASPSVFVGSWQENMSEVKLMGLKSFYGEDVVIECVLTDHHDDMPLLLVSKRRVLVRPTDATLAAISNQFEFEIIY